MPDRNRATVRRFLRLLEDKDIDTWITLWSADASQYYPFGAAMFPPRIRGRQAVYERWRDMPGNFETLSFPLRETWADGDAVIAQFDGDCVMCGGERYRNSYLALFVFTADGLIREYWEYFDPIVAGTAFGLATVSYPGS